MNYIDMIATLGLGNAHPGGYEATLLQLQKHPIPPSSHVLEVGCGTGRTACLLASLGLHVTAVDNHPRMVHKAQRRIQEAGLPVTIMQADACALPFANHAFDVVFVESVTNFTPSHEAISEYARVLRPHGVLYDREFAIDQPLSPTQTNPLLHGLGMCELLTAAQWLAQLTAHGFVAAVVLENEPFHTRFTVENTAFVDTFDGMDKGALLDPDLWAMNRTYTDFIETYCAHSRSVLLRATKASS